MKMPERIEPVMFAPCGMNCLVCYKAGLVQVSRGTGGVTVTRPLEDITFLDIYREVECTPDEELFHFHEKPNKRCPVGRDGKAKCRPFMFCFEREGKLWFCTNNTKDVYKDMLENPEIEVSVSSPEYAWLRLAGKAVFEDNMEVKEACMANPIVKGQYQEASNPIFEVFYLENPHGVIADFPATRHMSFK